jgi:rhodanese-related sulfurtransferase
MKRIIFAAASFSLALSACSDENASSARDEEKNEELKAAPSSITDVSAALADQVIASDASLVVLDVRTPPEFAEGHISGATNIDFNADDFAANLAKLDPTKQYLLHCKSGNRSSKALTVMQGQGFRNIVHMTDGFDAWKNAGHPVKN